MAFFNALARQTQADPAYQAAWAGFNPDSLSQGLSPELRQYIANSGGRGLISPDGRYQISPPELDTNNHGMTVQDRQNGGAFWDFDSNGNYRQFRTKSMDDNWGALLPLGAAAAGMFMAGGLGGGAAAGGGSAGGAGGFVGEGALSGIPAWDGVAAGVGGAGTTAMGAGGALGGLPGAGSLGSTITSALGGGGGSNLLGLGATALGALAGSQGQQGSQSSTRAMDPRMDSLFYGDLAPRAQGLLGSQMPAAANAGNQMLSVGSGLLNTNRTPDVFGSKFYQGAADDIGRRTSDLLAQANLENRGNAIMTGGLGGSRQGVAEGLAAGKAADSLQGNLSQLALGQYNNDANRNLQAITLGAGLQSQGLNTQFQPLQNTSSVYQPFTGYGTTTNNVQSGGGWQGALGGALSGASMGRQMGWW